MLFYIIIFTSCKDKIVNDNCTLKKSDSVYNISEFSNILRNEYTNTEYNITIKNILSKKVTLNEYEIRVYLDGNLNAYKDTSKYKFFIYVYPIDKNIINLPVSRKELGFDVWQSALKYKTDKNNKKYIKMQIHSKIDYFEYIAFGIINTENYKRLFVIQDKNIILNNYEI